MAVAIVQSKTAPPAAAGANPSVRLNGVVANNTLLAFGLESDGTPPGLPTDSSGDVFTLIDQIAQGNVDASVTLSYCLRSKGGNEVVTCPTIAGSNLVVAELSGVATPVAGTNSHGLIVFNPSIPDGGMDGQLFGSSISGLASTSNAKGDLVFALCIIAGAATITFNSVGWTASGSGAAQGLTYDLRTIQVAGPSNLSPAWTFSAPSSALVMVVALPAA